MRYLRRQVINRRAPNDARLDVDINNNILMTSPAAVQVPAGTTSQRPIVGNRYGTSTTGDLSGMIRYNVTSDQLEGYQGGAWRAIRFKESIGIIQQILGYGDYIETVFGPLDPAPPDLTYLHTVDSNADWTAHGNLTTPGNIWTGANLIVIIETVIQVYNINYSIVDGGDVGRIAGKKYIQFGSAVPTGKPVVVLHGFDR